MSASSRVRWSVAVAAVLLRLHLFLNEPWHLHQHTCRGNEGQLERKREASEQKDVERETSVATDAEPSRWCIIQLSPSRRTRCLHFSILASPFQKGPQKATDEESKSPFCYRPGPVVLYEKWCVTCDSDVARQRRLIIARLWLGFWLYCRT